MKIESVKNFFKILRKWWLPLAVVLFFIYLMFFDKNNIRVRMEYKNELDSLKEILDTYLKQMKEDSIKIEELTRDKDAVVASMLICEMASYYKNQGKTLVDVMEEIYSTYGYFLDKLDSYTLKGIDGIERIKAIMKEMREKGKGLMDGISVVNDYTVGIDDLPKADVLKFVFADSSWIAIRPSGTEPKIKVYYSVKGENKDDASKVLEVRRAVIDKIINA